MLTRSSVLAILSLALAGLASAAAAAPSRTTPAPRSGGPGAGARHRCAATRADGELSDLPLGLLHDRPAVPDLRDAATVRRQVVHHLREHLDR